MKKITLIIIICLALTGCWLFPTELTWDEKNPVNYIYRPFEAIF